MKGQDMTNFPTDIPTLEEIPGRIHRVRDAIRASEEKAGLPVGEVQLQIVVKYQPIDKIRVALDAGARFMSHNIIHQLEDTETQLGATFRSPRGSESTQSAEGTELIHDASQWDGRDSTALPEAGTPPHWTHVIGHVQSNKVGKALQFSDCIETLDSLKLAQRINRLQGTRIERGLADTPFTVYIQVNSSGAESQYGIAPEKVEELAFQVAQLPYLRLGGLMTIGAHTDNTTEIAASFARVRELRNQLITSIPTCTQLSMGMTHDLDIAIAEGSTIVRVGTAIFGPRPRT
ncbi:YggS family pyridoxal phosphate-dependent enzyme [Actinotignum urinale]|nr:YggS family pyridoxal phosphate-dependent enzyme [Actinotignum urinale]MDY5151380.1 YggS family pyridoxal phosphate-dependent enzyme [Actinotignum urinale]